MGWVVGQVGFIQALIIIFISNTITFFTGLSAASIVTNIRIGAGGAYSIISKSLGFETGGAIGIPLYLSQAISVAFYIAGFTECWVFVFPGADFTLVALLTWAVLFAISYISAKFAFRLQYFILLMIALSLVSVFMAKGWAAEGIVAWRGIGAYSFWQVFAIFFPAVTGILAGISMSGELKNPERNIPVGTLAAIAISFIIYISLAVWFACVASPVELASDTNLILTASRWQILIIMGIMGATLSSALSMFVAAPRTLQALAHHQVIPFSDTFSQISKKGEPTPAILMTALISLITIGLGKLDAIAGILTMFFLITYGMLNICVFIEKSIGIVSFRPAFKVPLFVSLLGGLGCVYAMFMINQLFSIIAVITIIIIYVILIKTQNYRHWPDVRKGLFLFIAEQSLRIAENLPYHPKIWKPNLIVPVSDPKGWTGISQVLNDIVHPQGRVDFFKIITKKSITGKNGESNAGFREKTENNMRTLCKRFTDNGIVASSLVAEADSFLQGADLILQTRIGSLLPPNVLFIKLGTTPFYDDEIGELLGKINPEELGLMFFGFDPKQGLGDARKINLWVRKGSPNIDLAVLISLQLERNWDGVLRLLLAVNSEEERSEAMLYLEKIKKVMRLPADTELFILTGKFEPLLNEAPAADINIFGIAEKIDFNWMRRVFRLAGTSVIFLKDSKHENAFV
jgi:amino acid transporter